MTKVTIDIDIEDIQKLDKMLLGSIKHIHFIHELNNTRHRFSEIRPLSDTRHFLYQIEKQINQQAVLNYVNMYKNKVE